MGAILRLFQSAVGWLRTISTVLGWLGWTSIITGLVASIGGAVWSVVTGVPIPIAVMVGYCTLVGAVYLAMAPAAYRVLANAPAQKTARKIAPDYKAWRQVELITLQDAACLWCGYDPHSKPKASEIQTRLTIFFDAVKRGNLALAVTDLSDSHDLRIRKAFPEGWHSTTRSALKAFAKQRGDDPNFLRDD